MTKRIASSWHLHADLRDCGERCWQLPGAVDIRVYEPSGEVFRQGTRLLLQPKPFDMLMLMLRRPQVLVSRQTLHEVLWGGRQSVSAEVITKCAGKLRGALGGEDTGLLINVYGTGYRLTVTPRALSPGVVPRTERARTAPVAATVRRVTDRPPPKDPTAEAPARVTFGRRAGDRLLAIDLLNRAHSAPLPKVGLAEWLSRQGGYERLPELVRTALGDYASHWTGVAGSEPVSGRARAADDAKDQD